MNTDSEERLMIAELERIIRAEEAKPEAERDLALIDDCIKEIAEIKGVKAEFSEEEVAQITDKLIQTAEKTKKRKRFVRLVAGIAAAVVLVTGITACTINPALINWFVKIVRMPFGSAVNQDILTYRFQGFSKEYSSVEEFLKSNSLDIYYPTVLPNHIKLVDIEIIDENGISLISFTYNSDDFRYTIQLQYVMPTIGGEMIKEIEVADLHFNVYSKDGRYFSVAEENGNTYIVQSSNFNDIILFVGGLRKE